MKSFCAAIFISLLPAAALAQAISLGKPVQCTVGKDCFIQNYVDEDTTDSDTGYRDYNCGSLSYNKHTGTDIRLPNLAAMRRGVAVVAATDGTVRATRDNMQDISVKKIGKEAIFQRDCGNAVILDHPAGYVTKYCHMRNGSIAVKQGEKVKAGQRLGLVGLSGATEFPHLHFQVERLGRVLDPFTAEPVGMKCGTARNTLWNAGTAAEFAYRPTALLTAGFYPGEPKQEVLDALAAPPETISRTAPVITLWAEIMGARQGDTLSLTIMAPNGVAIATYDQPYQRNQATSLRYVGKKATDEGLGIGEYTGKIELKSPGKTEPVIMHEVKVNVTE